MKISTILFPLVMFMTTTMLMSTTALAESKRDAEPKPDKVISYKKIDGHDLKLHIFNPPGHKASDKSPAIVLFHGGGWKNGHPRTFYHQAKYLASRGMVAICPEYRIGSKHGTTPKECVKDAKSAMRWVRSHAEQLGIDSNRLAAGGSSAGGHMAAATALVKGFDEPGEDTSVSCRPGLLVLYNPVFDNSKKGYGYDRVKDYWQAFSPMHNIDKTAPPTLVLLGTADRLVPVATAEEYKKRMGQAGVRCELVLFKGVKHGAINRGSNHKKATLAVDRFLTSSGYLKDKPTIKKKKK